MTACAKKCAGHFFFECANLLPYGGAGELKRGGGSGKSLPAGKGNQAAKLLQAEFFEVVARQFRHRCSRRLDVSASLRNARDFHKGVFVFLENLALVSAKRTAGKQHKWK